MLRHTISRWSQWDGGCDYPRGSSSEPRARHCCSVGPGGAALGFVSRRKFYCCNYTAVRCAKTSSHEGEQPPAHEQENVFTPLFAGAFPSCPALACSDPTPQQSPLARTCLIHLRGLRGDPGRVCMWPSPHGWGPEPGCAGCQGHQRNACSSICKGHPEHAAPTPGCASCLQAPPGSSPKAIRFPSDLAKVETDPRPRVKEGER